MSEYKAVRGTQDFLPDSTPVWRRLEEVAHGLMTRWGYGEIRIPVFERTELFARGVGEATDIVQKEMYTFQDRKGRSLTLRPEGTAGVVRALLEHRLDRAGLPLKLYYLGPMFRYERPQRGRFRQFHQVGAEAIGSDDPALDVESMLLLRQYLEDLGITGTEVLLNGLGGRECRERYRDVLVEYFRARQDRLDADSLDRLERNPLRILDSKNPSMRELVEEAPSVHDSWTDEDRSHMERVETLLAATGVPYRVDPRLVRGLDYYTRTVFEIHHPELGAQSALGGGGRYDDLVETFGGPPTPAVGFSAGLERIVDVLTTRGLIPPREGDTDVFVAGADDAGRARAFELALELRSATRAETGYGGASLRAQLKRANRLGARYTIVLGERELAEGRATVKEMSTGEESAVPLEDIGGWVRERLGAAR
jgi:histidyl-tRNA synthetase